MESAQPQHLQTRVHDSGALGAQSTPCRIGVFELSVVQYRAGTCFDRHTHERPSALAVITGEYGEITTSTKRNLNSGDLMLRASGIPHANHFDADCTVLLAMIDAEPIDTGWRAAPAFDRNGTAMGKCSPLRIHHIANALIRGAPLDLLHAEDAMIESLAALGSESTPTRMPRSRPSWLTHILERIHTSTDPITVTDLAGNWAVNPSHMARVFRQWRGCTVSQYVRRLAAQRAAADLQRTTHSIAHIATRHGFADQSHLTRVFKSLFGLTPARYRRAHNPFKTGVRPPIPSSV